MKFDWPSSSSILEGFGGERITLHVLKTGLPFFDALRLYGAIDLYIGLREDVAIHDQGDRWEITGNHRKHRVAGRDVSTFRYIWTKRKPEPDSYCKALRDSLADGIPFNEEAYAPAVKAFKGLDSSLQAGIRDLSAAGYETLQSGQTSESTCCVTKIPLSDGLLAYCGKQRTEGIGDIVFLPIFEGQIDLSKVISPLRAWIGMPNVLCAQALALLALKTSLFAEGYHDRLTTVVYKTNFKGQRSDNYAGLIDIASTAIGRIKSPGFVAHAYLVFRTLVGKAWLRQGMQFKSTKSTPDALAMAYWLVQPVGKYLMAMITSQERLRRERLPSIFSSADYVKEVFEMTYGGWNGDYEAVRKFAKAVAAGIFFAREAEEREFKDRGKAWYGEVTMLRSAPSARVFIERAMILVEQGHREYSQVGTFRRDEEFDPQALLKSIGSSRRSFEEFRDLFRMYLVQASTYHSKDEPTEVPLDETSFDEVPIGS